MSRVFALLLVVAAAAPAGAVTFVIDFLEPGEAGTTFIGEPVDPLFSGIDPAQFEIELQQVRDYYDDVPSSALDLRSPIPAGMQLDVDFVLGELGAPPSNGDAAFFYAGVGTKPSLTSGAAGRAWIGVLGRSAYESTLTSASWVGSPGSFGVIAAIVAHEIAHNAGLDHVSESAVTTPGGAQPLMSPVLDGGRAQAFSFESLGWLASAFGLRPLAVPEAGTSLLLALALAALTARRRV